MLDFGLSKGGRTSNSRITLSGASIPGFTPHYAPLEQIEGTGTDEQSDLYSLVATLHHLLTAVELPTAITRARAQIMQTPDPLRPANELNPQVPAAVPALLTQALALNPNHRPASAKAMRTALRTAGHQKVQPASPQQAASTSPPLLGQQKRVPVLIATLLVLLVLIGGGIGISSQWDSESSAATDFIVTPTTPHAMATATETAKLSATATPTSARTTAIAQKQASQVPLQRQQVPVLLPQLQKQPSQVPL